MNRFQLIAQARILFPQLIIDRVTQNRLIKLQSGNPARQIFIGGHGSGGEQHQAQKKTRDTHANYRQNVRIK
jgi:hypothetical protein